MVTGPSLITRRFRWSVATMMGLVAAVAILVASYLALTREEPHAPGSVLGQLPQRMQRLRPGMTDERIWRELGLAGYRKGMTAGRGPFSNYSTAYSPGDGYQLLMHFDERSDPPRFIRATLNYSGGQIETPPNPKPY